MFLLIKPEAKTLWHMQNLNTSHVLINRNISAATSIMYPYLNTSHVLINQKTSTRKRGKLII